MEWIGTSVGNEGRVVRPGILNSADLGSEWTTGGPAQAFYRTQGIARLCWPHLGPKLDKKTSRIEDARPPPVLHLLCLS